MNIVTHIQRCGKNISKKSKRKTMNTKNLYSNISDKFHQKGLNNENSYSNISIITGTCETSRTQRKRACVVLLLLNHFHIL